VTPEFASSSTATAHVFVEQLRDEIHIVGSDGHHLARVRRVNAGELLTAADGTGAWREYAVIESAKASVRAGALGPARSEPKLAPSLTVAFGLTKGEKPEYVVQKLTELGIDVIVPLMTSRSVLRWNAERAAVAADRYRRVAREAAMQCRRARLPEVRALSGLGELEGRDDLVLADRGGGTIEQVVGEPASSWCVVTGPEGGFDAEELGVLSGAVRLSVGPHVLRAETAAVAVAAALTAFRSPCQ